jgi:hypothetical protein
MDDFHFFIDDIKNIIVEYTGKSKKWNKNSMNEVIKIFNYRDYKYTNHTLPRIGMYSRFDEIYIIIFNCCKYKYCAIRNPNFIKTLHGSLHKNYHKKYYE